MDELQLLWLGLVLSLSAITYLSLSQRQRSTIADRLLFRRRRGSSARTPPRSFSPVDKAPSNAAASSNEYATIFPPSQRHTLPHIAPTLAKTQREQLDSVVFHENSFKNNLIGWDEDYRSCDDSAYVASGFSINEIKALGDFPDYATLTEVPHPKPYHDFDIDKAIPRPYRPFRWAYHQTMCKDLDAPDS